MSQKIINFYLLVEVLSSLGQAVTSATYVTFLLSHHLNLLQVNLINTAFMVTLAIFEIPTGIVADIFGRKKSFIISCFIVGFGFLVYFTAANFWSFITAEIILAIGITFSSGALEAWLVDSLNHIGFTGKLEKVFSKVFSFRIGAKIIAVLVGALMANKNLTWPWLAAALVYLILGLIAIVWMKENYWIKQKITFERLKNQIGAISASGFNCVVKSKNVLLVIVLSAICSFVYQGPNMQWQPYFVHFSANKLFLGWIMAGIYLASLIGVLLSPWLIKLLGNEQRVIYFSCVVIGLGLMLTASNGFLFSALFFFFVHELGRGTEQTIHATLLNKLIVSKERATILSFKEMIKNLGSVSGLLISGCLAMRFSIDQGWIISGLILGVLSGLIILLYKK
ncbi:MAG: MFS transporter [Patescibacteria group bacterium]|nr:MFS transporter [Patescibacteria group bacterium]MDD5164246.1 MFS transporter [Patescibacteria group bacterium]MDD5534696.1 MFS transporter [Patescibacteria group bacterium]